MKHSEKNTMYRKVYKALEQFPNTRDSDKKLWVAVIYMNIKWAIYVKKDHSISVKDIIYLPNYDVISRCRRFIQHTEGLFPPTKEEVLKARKIKQTNYRKALAKKDVSVFDDKEINLQIKLID